MALDLNQTDKQIKKIIVARNEVPGNHFLKGVTTNIHTQSLNYAEFFYSTFYFPVDCAIWSAGMQVTTAVNRQNDHSDIIPPGARTRQPSNAEGYANYGISLVSPRDKVWDGVDGGTPMPPGQKMARDEHGGTMEWDAYGSITPGVATTVQLPTRARGWINKAARQLIAFGVMGVPGTKTVNIDFTKTVKSRKKGRKSKRRAFDVDAGTKLVFWARNLTGSGSSDMEIEISTGIVPRVQFFPKEDICNGLHYNDQAEQRWGNNTKISLSTGDGDGVHALWLAAQSAQQKV